jgi:UDP-N-acetylmuramate dehydrogenase
MLPRLRAIHGLKVLENAPLSQYTRFGLGGEATLLVDVETEHALQAALGIIQSHGAKYTLIGGGSNLVASDEGFSGVVLRYTHAGIAADGTLVTAGAGAILQTLVDTTISLGLKGLETMTGIPGWVGGAVYGNAGAYGHSIQERVMSVRFFDGHHCRDLSNVECQFHYRESIFKQRKDWVILSAVLSLDPANPAELHATADGILKIRNEKYPPTMKCAGSIFKNLLIADLPHSVLQQVPERVIREGKIPSAYFLEAVGAKGMVMGGVRVADYHANLIYNEGGGTALEVRALIAELKRRVEEKFGLELEEEVQYI